MLTDTLLKSIDNRTRGSCTHYTIDCDVYVHPPLHDTEKVSDHFSRYTWLTILTIYYSVVSDALIQVILILKLVLILTSIGTSLWYIFFIFTLLINLCSHCWHHSVIAGD